MWPRRSKDFSEELTQQVDAERVARAWKAWEDRWDRPEEERLARKLRSNGASASGPFAEAGGDATSSITARPEPELGGAAGPPIGDGAVAALADDRLADAPGVAVTSATEVAVADALAPPPKDPHAVGPGAARDGPDAPWAGLLAAQRDGVQADVRALEQERDTLLAAVQTLRVDMAALGQHRQDVAAATDAEEAATAALLEERQHLAAEVEATRRALEEERRHLAAAAEERLRDEEEQQRTRDSLQADQFEVERLRRMKDETSERLEQEVSVLEDQRSQLLASVRTAALSADQARAAEQDALARLEAAKEQARIEEAQRLDVWVSLDAEITALELRRDGRELGTVDLT